MSVLFFRRSAEEEQEKERRRKEKHDIAEAKRQVRTTTMNNSRKRPEMCPFPLTSWYSLRLHFTPTVQEREEKKKKRNEELEKRKAKKEEEKAEKEGNLILLLLAHRAIRVLIAFALFLLVSSKEKRADCCAGTGQGPEESSGRCRSRVQEIRYRPG